MFPDVDVFRHIVITNSVAGLWYMHSEYEALRTQESMYLGIIVYRVPNRTLSPVFTTLFTTWIPPSRRSGQSTGPTIEI